MDVLGWLWWLVTSVLALAWSVVWFLLGGWVSTLAQIGVVVLVVFGMKFGWRRAPHELMTRAGRFVRFVWAWMRNREPSLAASATVPRTEAKDAPSRRRARPRSRRQPGDVRINVSTCMTLAMLVGLWLLTKL